MTERERDPETGKFVPADEETDQAAEVEETEAEDEGTADQHGEEDAEDDKSSYDEDA